MLECACVRLCVICVVDRKCGLYVRMPALTSDVHIVSDVTALLLLGYVCISCKWVASILAFGYCCVNVLYRNVSHKRCR
jgi:hypothetical protein